MNSDKLKVAVISIFSFPNGLAATNRIMAYSLGLVEAGVDTTIVMPTPPETANSTTKLPNNGSFNGIKYVHLNGRKRNKYRIFRTLALKTGYRFKKGVSSTRKWLTENKPDIVILTDNEPKWLKAYSEIANELGIKSIFIFDEYPIPIRQYLAKDIPEWKKQEFRKVLPQIDGYISITKNLEDFYGGFAKKPCFLMPCIVNTSRFPNVKIKKTKSITYMGNMDLTKDNVDIIIKAFAQIHNEFPEYRLDLYGAPSPENKKKLQQLIVEKGLSGYAILHNPVPNSEVYRIIAQSSVMVSSQPNTVRASGGFPTKLGEYLVMGIPTVMTDVGENSKYVTEEDCYFVSPENVEEYSECLKNILTNYDDATKKAAHGKQTIRENYSHTAWGKKLKSFLLDIKNS